MSWIAQCGAASVVLNVMSTCPVPCDFVLTVTHEDSQGTAMTASPVRVIRGSSRFSCDGCTGSARAVKYLAAGRLLPRRQATYKYGSKDLMNAVEGPCRRRGISCTDFGVAGCSILELGKLILFKCD